MQVNDFIDVLGADFYSGVPDSLLKPLGDYLMDTYGIDGKHHVIAANEGNCTALAAGYHLATGKVPAVYMQNSGQGNIINPVASLLNDKVYAIPCIFVVGWRGEPGVHDEPQHIYQGEVTVKLLDDMDISNYIVDKSTTVEDIQNVMTEFRAKLAEGKSVGFVVRKGALEYKGKTEYKNEYTMSREDIIKHIVAVSGDSPVVSTTGKASRELFEIREAKNEGHGKDFLTVGCMGHSSSIALGIALNKPNTTIWCIDGDGAVLMHMGSMAVIGAQKPSNMIHVVINNEAHETVGGLPTVAGGMDIVSIAKACGYEYAASVDNFDDLDRELNKISKLGVLSMLEVKCSIGARADLGRPTTTAVENKKSFMRYLVCLE
ncbi:MAG: phosphonopyruvate decarboxylase [Wujia sp.]